ncbi:uncharacterized protein CLBA1 isoform X1 [Saccopteryx bilineata]|uniref:uncharacterized protein CLBA1 isoform X1 n=2 Tax=Saccopteryx bilineata TaxID=59482 RepID=UPI00339017C7
MQGPWELEQEPGRVPPPSGSPSDLTEEASKVSLHQASEDGGASEAPGRQSGARVQWVTTRSHLPSSDREAWISGLSEGFPTCTAGGLGPGEHSGTWGEFEGFQESSAKSEQFCQPFELPERPTAPQLPRTASAQECGSHQPHQGGPWVTGIPGISPAEPLLSYESIFRSAFQEAPAPQATEGVFALDHFLQMSPEEKPGLGSAHEWCSESRKLWNALQNADGMSTSRCLWSRSRCREAFFRVLRVNAAQNLSGSQGHALEGSELKELEDTGVHGLRLHGCRALIQTKLSGTPGGRQGHLITCSLSLQTSSPRNGRCVPAPQRKAFHPRDLKMTLFPSDVA